MRNVQFLLINVQFPRINPQRRARGYEGDSAGIGRGRGVSARGIENLRTNPYFLMINVELLLINFQFLLIKVELLLLSVRWPPRTPACPPAEFPPAAFRIPAGFLRAPAGGPLGDGTHARYRMMLT